MTAQEALIDRIRSGVPGIVWPPVAVGPLAALAALAGLLERTQWLPAAEIESLQYRQLPLLAAHADRHSRHFAGRLAAASLTAADLASPEGLRRLPVLRRRDIQKAGADFYCDGVPEGHGPVREARTSGSSGQPIKIRRSAVSQLYWRALNLRSHDWFGRDLGERCTVIRVENDEHRISRHWGPPIGLLFETGPLQTMAANVDIAEQVRLLAEFGTECLVVYPNNLDAIRRHCQGRGIALPRLRRILTMSESLREPVRREAEAYFKVPIFDAYSSGEMGIAALQCPMSGLYHVMAENQIAEVLDERGNSCRPGEIGRLVLTDLSNFASPLIRYDVADYAEVAPPCPCGRGLPTLARIVGRERNILRRPDGQRYWPRLSMTKYRDVAPVLEHQILQRELDLLEMRLVVEVPLTAGQEADLAALVRKAVGYPFRISFLYFAAEIPRSASGKLEEFVCLLPEEDQ
jgi:phenylacetate-CoA ligase